MKKQYRTDELGRCVISVSAFSQPGEFATTQVIQSARAMIDITQPSSYVNRNLADKLGLKIKTQMDGQPAPEHTLIGINLKELWGNGGLGLHTLVFDEDMGCDIILGCDFMSNVNFTRYGREKLFTLESVQAAQTFQIKPDKKG